MTLAHGALRIHGSVDSGQGWLLLPASWPSVPSQHLGSVTLPPQGSFRVALGVFLASILRIPPPPHSQTSVSGPGGVTEAGMCRRRVSLPSRRPPVAVVGMLAEERPEPRNRSECSSDGAGSTLTWWL